MTVFAAVTCANNCTPAFGAEKLAVAKSPNDAPVTTTVVVDIVPAAMAGGL